MVQDKIGRLSSEPIIVLIANISYQKRKITMLSFVLDSSLRIQKTQLESQKDSNKLSTKKLSNEFNHKYIEFMLQDLINIHKRNDVEMMVNINGQSVILK